MVKKVFLSSQKSGYISSAQLGITEHRNYVLIALFGSEPSDIPSEIVLFDKDTAVSFVNELKRQIAKIDKAPF